MPLPGLTPADVVSQLAHRVFGPLQLLRAQIVLNYRCLLGYPWRVSWLRSRTGIG